MSEALNGLREEAWRTFESTGLPTTHREEWKYTDLTHMQAVLGENWWQPAGGAAIEASQLDSLAIAGLDGYRLVFVNGQFHPAISQLPDGVEVLPQLMASDAERAKRTLAVDAEAPLFNGAVAANAALATDGACVHVADQVRLDKPLYLLHAAQGPGCSHLRHGLWLGRQAEAHVIEHYVGDADEAALTNSVTLVHLDEGAQLHHDRLQVESMKQFHLGRLDVMQARDSCFVSHSAALGGALSRVDIAVKLNGEGASCTLNGLYLIGGRQHADHHTRIEHAAPHCSSRESYRGVMDGRAHGVFNGMVVVKEGAVKTDSAQSNANLLLSKTAVVDAKPELEIDNNDVKASHGCTVGQLDAKQLFYLQSRGLSAEDAREVLTFAFADEVLAGLKLRAVRRYVERAAFAKLPHGADLEEMLA